MKTYTINYIMGLGSFLDDRDVEWKAENGSIIAEAPNSENTISIVCVNDTEFSRLMIEFGEHKDEYQS